MKHLRERNRLHFEDCETFVLSLKFTFMRSLLDWVVVYGPSSSFLNLFKPCKFFRFWTPLMVVYLVYILCMRAVLVFHFYKISTYKKSINDKYYSDTSVGNKEYSSRFHLIHNPRYWKHVVPKVAKTSCHKF